MIFSLIKILFLFFVCVYSDPLPDTSDKCLSCQDQVKSLEYIWTNATTVEEILNNLDSECKSTFPITNPMKIQVCEDLASIFVQIPPSLFKGMDDLAWPIPEAPCALLMQCQMNCCGESDPPEQVHLSLASDDYSVMGVSWVTLSSKRSIVQYGLSQSSLTKIVSGDTTTYRASGWVGTIHRAKMTGLEYGTKYYYRVGNGYDSWSDVFYFSTMIPFQDVTYAVLADMDFDSSNTISNLIDLVSTDSIDVVIHSGDISYADGYEPHWDLFFNRMQPIVAYVPYMVTPGNHEFWFNFTSYKKRFYLPGVLDEGGSGDGMYYSWNCGKTHFIAGNSETAIDTANFSTTFISWLENDLKSVDRELYPWVVAHFHRPFYCSNNNACTTKGGNTLRNEAEQLFYDYKVNIGLYGHVHSYERTYPLYNSTTVQFNYENPQGTVYILQGGSGNREGNDGYPTELPDWSSHRESAVGYGIMTITDSIITFDYYESRLSSEGGPILLDSFNMTTWGN